MNRQSLRPIAICVMLAYSVPAFAQTGAATVKTTNASTVNGAVAAKSVPGSIEGRAVDAAGKPVSNASVRLRDLQSGRIDGSIVSNTQGTFAFGGVKPGSYVAELMSGAGGKVVATSQMLAVGGGEAVSAFIKIPALLSSLGGTIAANAAVAAIVIAAAAAAGVLVAQAGDCVSPPCQ